MNGGKGGATTFSSLLFGAVHPLVELKAQPPRALLSVSLLCTPLLRSTVPPMRVFGRIHLLGGSTSFISVRPSRAQCYLGSSPFVFSLFCNFGLGEGEEEFLENSHRTHDPRNKNETDSSS